MPRNAHKSLTYGMSTTKDATQDPTESQACEQTKAVGFPSEWSYNVEVIGCDQNIYNLHVVVSQNIRIVDCEKFLTLKGQKLRNNPIGCVPVSGINIFLVLNQGCRVTQRNDHQLQRLKTTARDTRQEIPGKNWPPFVHTC